MKIGAALSISIEHDIRIYSQCGVVDRLFSLPDAPPTPDAPHTGLKFLLNTTVYNILIRTYSQVVLVVGTNFQEIKSKEIRSLKFVIDKVVI